MPRNDEQIKKDVVDQLYWDNTVDASQIKVTVANGVVTLEGGVPSYTSRAAAYADALNVAGVQQVVDTMHVEYPAVSADDELEAACQNILALNPDIDETNIDVEVERGVVTLRGIVDAYWKRAYGEELIAKVKGVVLVVNNLAVVPTRATVDEDIANDIVAALNRSMLVDSSHVDVKVEDGRVTLTGTVPSWPARMTARNIAARTFGVVDVMDNLRVEAVER